MVLAGGVGSRFWPVSTPARPKQVLPLGSERPLIADAVDRIGGLVPADRLRLLAGAHLVEPLLRAAPALSRDQLWVEPDSRGTAPVLAWAAARIARLDPDAVMVSLHSDHIIEPASAFRSLVAMLARLAARAQRLFTIGVQPTRPESGYGYLRLGEPLTTSGGVYAVERFVEKPDVERARRYLEEGGYLWNSGIFLWSVRLFLDELRAHTPELADLLPLLDEGRDDAFFQRAPHLSVDEGVLERSQRVAAARATFDWDDVGSWDAVGRCRAPDASGNVGVGGARFVGARDCIGWSDDGQVVLFGTEGLVVVRTAHITLVMPRARSGDLKRLLGELPEDVIEDG